MVDKSGDEEDGYDEVGRDEWKTSLLESYVFC